MPPSPHEPALTLVAGATVCVSAHDGSVRPDRVEGLFHRDARVLSRLELTVDGVPPTLLAAERDGGDRARQVLVARADPWGSPSSVLERERTIGSSGLSDRCTLRVYAGRVREVAVRVEADLAPLHKGLQPGEPVPWRDGEGPSWTLGVEPVDVRLEIVGPLPRRAGERWVWPVELGPGDVWEVELRWTPLWHGRPVMSGTATDPAPLAVESDDPRWSAAVRSACADVAALGMDAPELDLAFPAAGAPWFLALFGRDALLAGWESLLWSRGPAMRAIDALARYQGHADDPVTLEQPGRILHELRVGTYEVFGVPSGQPYYGTVDASPLFVMLLDELHRWGAPEDWVRARLDAARGALDWCRGPGDLLGDGFVSYEPHADGLDNQGWKDSGDAMVHADGRQAEGAIALAEVQGYVHAAWLALARLEERLGDPGRAPDLRAEAAELARRFRAAFWLEPEGLVAMALDGERRPLAVASSNPGHCLWSGVLDDDVAAAVAERLCRDDLLARWGVRTLGSGNPAYNPFGYHLGSIWPHDSAIVAAGLARAGHADGAARVIDGLLEVARHTGWRLPELLSGWSETEVPFPVAYPVSASPQAWSAAAPLLLLRTRIGLEPDLPAGRIVLRPLPDVGGRVHVSGVPVGDAFLTVRLEDGTVEVDGVPDGVEVVVETP